MNASWRGVRPGAPGDFAGRLGRVEDLRTGGGGAGGAAAPLALLEAVLRHQEGRAPWRGVTEAATALAAGAELRMAAGRFPLLDLAAGIEPIAAEIPPAVTALEAGLPDQLRSAGRALLEGAEEERRNLVEAWLEDPAGPEPVLGFWVRVVAGPILEAARAAIATPSRE